MQVGTTKADAELPSARRSEDEPLPAAAASLFFVFFVAISFLPSENSSPALLLAEGEVVAVAVAALLTPPPAALPAPGTTASSLAVVVAGVVMYDASGVRLHAGRQASVLNVILTELPPEHPASDHRPLRDTLGHTPLQVLAGAALGALVGFAVGAAYR